jgi:hypothetical protein
MQGCNQGQVGTNTPARLVAAAFPALQRLELEYVSLNWKDLHALICCSQLSYLVVVGCSLPAAAPATNPLAALASLRELHAMDNTSSSIVRGLTQLISLRLCSRSETPLQLTTGRLDGMQQLQQLELRGFAEVTADMVAQLFSATPELKDLVLGNIIRQEAFDALLAHATHLTRLSCMGLECQRTDPSQHAAGRRWNSRASAALLRHWHTCPYTASAVST